MTDRRSFPPDEQAIRDFYASQEWKRASYRAKLNQGERCQCCGISADEGARITTDHVRPIRYYWHLRLERSNLQVLCDDCNYGKGSWDQTDFRVTFAERLQARLAHLRATERGPELKDAITTAHSFGILNQEDAIGLIRQYGLEAA